MSTESKDNNWIVFVIILVFVALKEVFRWIENNPFTFAWILAIGGVIIWIFLNRNSNSNTPNEPPKDHF